MVAGQMLKLAMLNPAGRDAEQWFPDHAGEPSVPAHAPVNYHAYAACTAGSFHRDTAKIPQDSRAVLLLLRRDLGKSLDALRALKRAGKIVAVSWKESGMHQVAGQLDTAKNIALFREVCGLADGALSSTPTLVPVYLGAGARHVKFIPTPYPVDDARWDFSEPMENRKGVLIGTREFGVPSRNHLAALLAARTLGAPVTVFNFEGRAAARRLAALEIPQLTVLTERLPYPEYLGVVARHRLVFQLDRSGVPGQVAGDALLCRVPCVGGDGAVDGIAFPGGADPALLLRDDAANAACVESSQRRAGAELSFAAVAARLAVFFEKIAR
jgi:hypothetical protein